MLEQRFGDKHRRRGDCLRTGDAAAARQTPDQALHNPSGHSQTPKAMALPTEDEVEDFLQAQNRVSQGCLRSGSFATWYERYTLPLTVSTCLST